MELTPLVKTLVIMNNYFHDVATAMLFSSALILWLLGRNAEKNAGAEAENGAQRASMLASAYPVLTRVAWGSIAWIVVGGIPRTIFFEAVEWDMSDPSNKYLFTALMIKHALMWLLVIAGTVMWARARKVARQR